MVVMVVALWVTLLTCNLNSNSLRHNLELSEFWLDSKLVSRPTLQFPSAVMVGWEKKNKERATVIN